MPINDRDWHHEEVEKTRFFCPNCGDKNVYIEKGIGDYYEGEGHYCKNCNFHFTMPTQTIEDTIKWTNKGEV